MELGVHFVHVQTFVLVGVKVLVHSLVNLEEQLLSLCVVVLSKRHTAVVCKLGSRRRVKSKLLHVYVYIRHLWRHILHVTEKASVNVK